MDFEKAKVIQGHMNEVSKWAKDLMSVQRNVSAAILNAITSEEDCQEDIRTVLSELLIFTDELTRAIEAMEDVVAPFTD